MLSLADAKIFLNIPAGTTTDDTEITNMISEAYAAITVRVGELDLVTGLTARVRGGSGHLVVPRGPVNSVTSITPVGGAALDVTQYINEGRAISSLTSSTWTFSSQFYDVVYTAGRNPVPGDLAQAVKQMLLHMWQTQRGGSVRRQSGQDQGPPPGSAYLIPYRVAELIAPHLQAGFA